MIVIIGDFDVGMPEKLQNEKEKQETGGYNKIPQYHVLKEKMPDKEVKYK
jgi:hypothetical protein